MKDDKGGGDRQKKSGEPQKNRPAGGKVVITGEARVGQTLTADTSGIRDQDGTENARFSYQWVSGGADVQGATGAAYTLRDEDEGLKVKVFVTFTDDAGNAEAMTSKATGPVEPETPPNTPATGLPAINGTLQVDETLTVDVSGIADADGLDTVSYSYQWLAGGRTSTGPPAPATSSPPASRDKPSR